MKVAIVGYGRMGRLIASLLIDNGNEVVAVIDPVSTSDAVTDKHLDAKSVMDADIVIDFSSPQSAVDNIIMYAKLGIPAVIGTTGWYEEKERVADLCNEYKSRILYSGNYSLGVAVFLKLARRAGELINRVGSYDVSIREVHHTGKADSPSGTALMIADELISSIDSKHEILIGNSDGRIRSDQLQIVSERVGRVPGIHEILIDGDYDSITLTHSARTREGFASGAIAAAEWLLETDRYGLLSMDDFLDDLLGDL
mgnify:CR=1 FL=1